MPKPAVSEHNPQVYLTRPDQARPNLGLAELTVVNLTGRSVVAHQYSQAPLQLHRPLYLDQDDFPTVFMKTPSAGLLGGDRHYLKLFAAEKSTVKMLNQSATLVYPGQSELEIEIAIEKEGTVFFEPCPLILHQGASLKQVVRIDMHSRSRLRYIDEWSAGRIAMNESFRFQCFDNTIEIWMEGELKYRERFVLTPGQTEVEYPPEHPLIAGKYRRFKSIYQFGLWNEEQTEERSDTACEFSGESAGQSVSVIPPVETGDRSSLTWRMKRPIGSIERLLTAPSQY